MPLGKTHLSCKTKKKSEKGTTNIWKTYSSKRHVKYSLKKLKIHFLMLNLGSQIKQRRNFEEK